MVMVSPLELEPLHELMLATLPSEAHVWGVRGAGVQPASNAKQSSSLSFVIIVYLSIGMFDV
jgi:hypothetical protein